MSAACAACALYAPCAHGQPDSAMFSCMHRLRCLCHINLEARQRRRQHPWHVCNYCAKAATSSMGGHASIGDHNQHRQPCASYRGVCTYSRKCPLGPSQHKFMAAGMESECKWPFSSDVNLSMRGSCVDYACDYAWGFTPSKQRAGRSSKHAFHGSTK